MVAASSLIRYPFSSVPLIEALCKIYGLSLKEMAIEETFQWANRYTDSPGELKKDIRRKLGNETKHQH
jgi:hypothetical protein